MTKIDMSFAGAIPAGDARPMLEGARAPGGGVFEGFLRAGTGMAEAKAFTGVTGADGGYAVPREIDQVIDAALKSASPIRSIANVVQVGSNGYRKLVTAGGIASGWASERARQDAIPAPTGGANPDAEAPVAIDRILDALKAHGLVATA